jgi:uncharacterized protein with von Willebrand factor type A (vWA) domain
LFLIEKKERERETGYLDIEQQPQSRRTISIFIFILFCAAALVLPPFSFIETIERRFLFLDRHFMQGV